MNEIKILDKLPVVLTKDRNWRPKAKIKAGSILLLPEDAIVVIAPTE